MFDLRNWAAVLLVWAIIFRVSGLIVLAAVFATLALLLIPPIVFFKIFWRRG